MAEADEAQLGSDGSNAADDSAQDLDALLSEFDGDQRGDADSDSKPDGKVTDYGKKAYEMLQAEQSRRAAEQYRRDVDSAVSAMQETIGRKDLDPGILEAYLEAEARRDQRITNAFQQRNERPDAWKGVVNGVAKKMAKALELQPDPELSDSVDAVRAAVSSTSSEGPDDRRYSMEELSKLSDWELQQRIKDYSRNLK